MVKFFERLVFLSIVVPLPLTFFFDNEGYLDSDRGVFVLLLVWAIASLTLSVYGRMEYVKSRSKK